MIVSVALVRYRQSHESPLPRLEKIAGWWSGAAATRRAFAKEAQDCGLDKLADEHLRAASEYERKAKGCTR